MAKNCAVVIGINEYDEIQPLKYAKSDAERVQDYFLRGLGVHPDHLYFFSDDSPRNNAGRKTQPTYGTLHSFLNDRFAQPFLEPGDTLWFYFSGHGMPHKGRDYLLPIDGNPRTVPNLAIPINYITERLRGSGADNIILFIDACRSTGEKSAGLGIGEEKQQGVITFYSCSPSQVSYEIEEIQQGAFTHVLLNGLEIQGEGNCATVERLYNYLRYQVPQVTLKHKGYQQTPYAAIEPATKLHYILLPKFANQSDINVLKKDALNAEFVIKDFSLALQYWRRVIAAVGDDDEALQAIVRLGNQQSSHLPVQVSNQTPPESQQPAIPNNLERIDIGQGITLELVRIHAGKFTMGMPPAERKIALKDVVKYGWDKEAHQAYLDFSTPQHEIHLQEFWMGTYTVTNAQWQIVMKTNPSKKYGSKFQGDMQPVVGISWYEAVEFCGKLSEQTGKTLSLPTEVEWEYACRAGTTTAFAFGETITTNQINYNGNYPYGDSPKGKYRGCTVDVNSFSPNSWGLYQMHGNVWEWCRDKWHGYSDKLEKSNINGNKAWNDLDIDDAVAHLYVCRGGSWYSNGINCRSAYRNSYLAQDQHHILGFRVVLESW